MMTSQYGDDTKDSAQTIAAVLLLLGALLLGIWGFTVSSNYALLGGGFVSSLAALLLPRNSLPAVAMWALVLFPVGYIDGVPATVGRYMTPAVLVIAVWMIRLALAQRTTLLLQMPIRGWIIAAPLLVLLFTSAVFSVDNERTSAWLAVFMICVIAPALIGQVSLDDVWPPVRRTLAGIGLFLGVLATADFFIRFNPWTSVYAYQVSSTATFRAFTSLGHPLNTALVAGVAVAACLFPSSKGRQWPYMICAAGGIIAVVFTVSRTSVIAVGVLALIGILSARPTTTKLVTRKRGRFTLLLITGILFCAVALSPLLRSRSASAEGSVSALYRSQLVDTAKTLIGEHPTLGYGPGTSARLFEATSPDGLENSALQFTMSNGIPAFLVFLVGLCTVVAVAMRRSRPGAAAGIVAFAVSATGFTVLDSNPAMLALIAPLIVCAVTPGPGVTGPVEVSAASPSRRSGRHSRDHDPTRPSTVTQ